MLTGAHVAAAGLIATVLAACTGPSVIPSGAGPGDRSERGPVVGGDSTLRPGGRIAGRISQPDGTPEAGAKVFAAVRRPDGTLTFAGSTTAEWDGRYEVAGLAAGEFLVLAEPDPLGAVERLNRHAPPPLPTLYPGVAANEPGEPVRVFEGIATEGIDIWLSPGAQRFSASGRLTWPDGVTVENMTIEYGGPGAQRSGLWYVNDPGGLFTIEGLAEGTLVLLARADSSTGPLAGLVATRLTRASVEEMRLPLGPLGSIEGRVRTEGSGESTVGTVRLVHELLDVSPLYPVEEAAVGADGRFAIPSALGEYSFAVDGPTSRWRVVQVLRGGRAVDGNRIRVSAGERVTAIELVVRLEGS